MTKSVVSEVEHHANLVPRLMVDGAQGMVHCPPDVQALDIDFYALSGHKLYGPMGIDLLYGKAELWSQKRACLTEEQLSVIPSFRSFRCGHCQPAGV